MSKIARKQLFVAVICSVALLFSFGLVFTPIAHADTGPKPSVIVTVENLDGRACYGTLLSKHPSTGPQIAYEGNPDHKPWFADPESSYYDPVEAVIWNIFVNYVDADGYYYLQCHWNVGETSKISWTYYPPTDFKILLYFPDTQSFVTSEIYQSYAFHSYFNIKLNDNAITDVQVTTVTASKSYDYTWELISLFIRIIVTVLIELGVAYLMRLRTKKQILTILIVNIITQTALNVALNILAFFQGGWALLWYIPLEIAVFIAESVAYAIMFSRTQSRTVDANGDMTNKNYISTRYCALYSFCANMISFAAGFALALLIPGIF